MPPPADVTLRQSKITPPRGTVLEPGRGGALDHDEPTRALDPGDSRPRFLPPNDVRTALTSATARRMPAGGQVTLRDFPAVGAGPIVPASPSAAPSPPSSAPLSAPAVTAPMATIQAPDDREGPTGEHPRPAKVWVATHKAPDDPDPRLILLREPDSARAAAFRVLRHRLAERSDPRVIAVTSAEAGEGKTTCAANLAMALGECNRARVLLVEANRRAPALAALFGFLPPECFALQLRRHRDRPLDQWSMVEVFSPALHVLAVKPGPENENRPLLDGIAFGVAMEMLRASSYDYIVVDTPPVLGSADVNLVEDHVDGVLLTTWARKSNSRALRRAAEQLAPAKILGLTLLDA
ncbi:MAG TPA: CpsD/CapB family tyrosine-protein kinase [Polyangia bacterium]